jgi:hypothetical protein
MGRKHAMPTRWPWLAVGLAAVPSSLGLTVYGLYDLLLSSAACRICLFCIMIAWLWGLVTLVLNTFKVQLERTGAWDNAKVSPSGVTSSLNTSDDEPPSGVVVADTAQASRPPALTHRDLFAVAALATMMASPIAYSSLTYDPQAAAAVVASSNVGLALGAGGGGGVWVLDGFDRAKAVYAPLLLATLALLVLNPCNVMRRASRFYLLRMLGETLVAPLAPVCFTHVLVGDCLASLSKALIDVSAAGCLAYQVILQPSAAAGAAGQALGSGDVASVTVGFLEEHTCKGGYFLPSEVISALPFFWRAMQVSHWYLFVPQQCGRKPDHHRLTTG